MSCSGGHELAWPPPGRRGHTWPHVGRRGRWPPYRLGRVAAHRRGHHRRGPVVVERRGHHRRGRRGQGGCAPVVVPGGAGPRWPWSPGHGSPPVTEINVGRSPVLATATATVVATPESVAVTSGPVLDRAQVAARCVEAHAGSGQMANHAPDRWAGRTLRPSRSRWNLAALCEAARRMKSVKAEGNAGDPLVRPRQRLTPQAHKKGSDLHQPD